MMYMGGKARLAKYIVPILQRYIDRRVYLEPFCGMCNIVKNVRAITRIASDIHPDLIMMLQEGQTGKFVPPMTVTEELHKSLKHAPPSALRAFVGFSYSFRGSFFGGFDHHRRHLYQESFRQLMRLCYNVTFYHCNYSQWYDIHDALIYCDPPYEGTSACGAEDFDTPAFWEQCRKWVAQNNIVFVSEYKAPKDFYPVWSMCRTDVDNKTSVQENLFVLEGSL